ncbi:MAG: shikimate dehydrogenase [Bacillota bacterium]
MVDASMDNTMEVEARAVEVSAGGRAMVDAGTRMVVLLGHPVHHSYSPAMQNAAFRAAGLNLVYLAAAVPPERLVAAVAAVAALDMPGANVTVPHKERVTSFLDEVVPEARLLGAVNTIVHRDGRLVGHNTDGTGFLRALREAGYDARGEAAVVLGAGGAARAVALSLAMEGAKEVVVFNRSADRAQQLAALVRERGGERAEALSWEALEKQSREARSAFARAGLVVQTTSLGMSPRPEDGPPVPPEWMSANHLAYDLVYNPSETAFLRMARQAGARTAGGAGMLLHQGAAAFELWTGREAPIGVMKQALEACLG